MGFDFHVLAGWMYKFKSISLTHLDPTISSADASDSSSGFVVTVPFGAAGAAAVIDVASGASAPLSARISQLSGKTLKASDLQLLAEELFDLAELVTYLSSRLATPRTP